MKPAIIIIAGFVVFNQQHTEFIKMLKKFVAHSWYSNTGVPTLFATRN